MCCQIAFQDDAALDALYRKCLAVEQQKIRSASLLRELATAAVTSQRCCFLVIDGLDECIGESPVHRNSEEAVEWLHSLIKEGVSEHCGQDKRNIHLLISGQRDGFLEERLRAYPQIRLEAAEAHRHDIEAYATSRSYQIQRAFRIDEGLRTDIVNKVCRSAKGVFFLFFLFSSASFVSAIIADMS